jgi:hypothetical protein
MIGKVRVTGLPGLSREEALFLDHMDIELRKAQVRFPTNEHLLAALTEEVGELAQALIDHDRNPDLGATDVYAEAVQVAAMVIRVALEGDASFRYRYPFPVKTEAKAEGGNSDG